LPKLSFYRKFSEVALDQSAVVGLPWANSQIAIHRFSYKDWSLAFKGWGGKQERTGMRKLVGQDKDRATPQQPPSQEKQI